MGALLELHEVARACRIGQVPMQALRGVELDIDRPSRRSAAPVRLGEDDE